jgi:hypothetical protein
MSGIDQKPANLNPTLVQLHHYYVHLQDLPLAQADSLSTQPVTLNKPHISIFSTGK